MSAYRLRVVFSARMAWELQAGNWFLSYRTLLTAPRRGSRPASPPDGCFRSPDRRDSGHVPARVMRKEKDLVRDGLDMIAFFLPDDPNTVRLAPTETDEDIPSGPAGDAGDYGDPPPGIPEDARWARLESAVDLWLLIQETERADDAPVTAIVFPDGRRYQLVTPAANAT
jgi:hypothetical protein